MNPKVNIPTLLDKAGPNKPNIKRHRLPCSNEEALADAVDFGQETGWPLDQPSPPGGTSPGSTYPPRVRTGCRGCGSATSSRIVHETGFDINGADSSFTIAHQGRFPMCRVNSPSQSPQVKVRERNSETGIPMNAIADEAEDRFPVFGSMKDTDSRTQMVCNRANGA